MAGTFALTAGTATINHILSEEANRISNDVHGYLLHKSPWIDLSTRGVFESGMGVVQNTLVYDRALPIYESTPGSGTFNTLGVNFVDIAATSPSGITTDRTIGQLAEQHIDARGPTYAAAQIDFTRKLRSFSPKKAVFFSPFLDIENLKLASHLTQQVGEMVKILADTAQWVMDERFKTEYDKTCDNVVVCKTSGSTISTGHTGTATGGIANSGVLDMDANSAALLPNANISHRVLDMVQIDLRIGGANSNAWGNADGQAVHALVLSSEASYRLKTESGFRDDFRYNDARVDELLKPLGVASSFRGYFHICDDLAPRFNLNTAGGGSAHFLERVQPYAFSGSVLVRNTSYKTATYEAAYVLHKDVCQHLIPESNVNAGPIKFNPQNYTGDYQWLNPQDININPFGTIGRFGGQFATATKPIKVDLGYRLIFDRTSATPAE